MMNQTIKQQILEYIRQGHTKEAIFLIEAVAKNYQHSILKVLRTQGPKTAPEIAEIAGIDKNNIYRILKRLESGGKVEPVLKETPSIRGVNTTVWRYKPPLETPQKEHIQRIITALERGGPQTSTEIAETFYLKDRTVRRALRDAEKQGLVHIVGYITGIGGIGGIGGRAPLWALTSDKNPTRKAPEKLDDQIVRTLSNVGEMRQKEIQRRFHKYHPNTIRNTLKRLKQKGLLEKNTEHGSLVYWSTPGSYISRNPKRLYELILEELKNTGEMRQRDLQLHFSQYHPNTVDKVLKKLLQQGLVVVREEGHNKKYWSVPK